MPQVLGLSIDAAQFKRNASNASRLVGSRTCPCVLSHHHAKQYRPMPLCRSPICSGHFSTILRLGTGARHVCAQMQTVLEMSPLTGKVGLTVRALRQIMMPGVCDTSTYLLQHTLCHTNMNGELNFQVLQNLLLQASEGRCFRFLFLGSVVGCTMFRSAFCCIPIRFCRQLTPLCAV